MSQTLAKTFYSDAKPIKAWVEGVEFDDNAFHQVVETARLPFIYKHVAIMPDVHYGIGATVGSVVPTQGAIVPAAVGVDIGCGMVAQRLNLTASDLPDNVDAIRADIEAAVPVGFSAHEEPVPGISLNSYALGYGVITDAGLWGAKQNPHNQLLGEP